MAEIRRGPQINATTTKHLRQFQLQIRQPKQSRHTIRFKLHQQVDVTVLIFRTAQERSKQRKAADAVGTAETSQFGFTDG